MNYLQKKTDKIISQVRFYGFLEGDKKTLFAKFIMDMYSKGTVIYENESMKFTPDISALSEDMGITDYILYVSLAENGIEKIKFYDNETLDYMGEVANSKRLGYNVSILGFLYKHLEQLTFIPKWNQSGSKDTVVFQLQFNADGKIEKLIRKDNKFNIMLVEDELILIN